MNLNILTSGLITSKFGIRPALMCATKKDLSKHSVIRILSDNASGWIGIAYGHLITGAKCQQGSETFNGFEALSVFLKLETGAFDLIQLDTRLIGDELAQSIGISIDELLEQLSSKPEKPVIEILRQCQKVGDAISVLLSTESNPRRGYTPSSKEVQPLEPEAAGTSEEPTDEDWELGDESVVDYLEKRSRKEEKRASSEHEIIVFASDGAAELESGSLLSQDLEPSANVETFEAFKDVGLPPDLPAVIPGSTAFSTADSLSSPTGAANRFLLLANEKNQWDGSDYQISGTDFTDHDRLGAELRAELHKFVEAKFGIEGKKFFEELDLEESKDYQSSIVLKDLEDAIEKSKDDLSSSGSFHKLAESVEKLKLKAEEAERIANWHRNRSTGEHKAVAAEADDSRKLVEEKIKKSTEVDTKAFLANQDSDTELEKKLLKEKRLRQIIISAAAICFSVGITTSVYHFVERQSSLETAQKKLHDGDLKGAKIAYEKLLQANPENWAAYLGHALCVPNDYKTQIEDYNHVLILKPDDFAAAIALARAYYDSKDYDHAVSAAERASKIDKSSISALKLRSDALFELGKYKESIKVLEEALALKPNHEAELYYAMASAFHELKDEIKQEECLRKALGIDPKNASYIKELALLKSSSLTPRDAKPFIVRALKELPGDADLHFALAKILAGEGAGPKAIEELSFAINHGLESAEALGMRGKLFFSRQMYGHAKSDLEEALQKGSKDASIRRTLALVEREIELAKKRAGTRVLPSDSGVDEPLPVSELQGDYVGRAYDLIKQGKTGYASRLLKAAVKSNPGDGRARRYLASALYYNGDYVGSSTQFAYAAAYQALSIDEKLLYGKALIKANRLEQAIKILGELVEEQPGLTKARVELIRAYSLAGFSDHAREVCQDGLKEARTPAEYAEIKSLMP